MGGGPYVLKEKFKDKLKIWNKEHFGDLQRRRRIIEYEMIILDKKGEKWGLPLKKCVLREKETLQDQLWSVAMSNESLLRQKSRDRWIVKGDCNTKYFYSMVNKRRRKSLTRGIFIGGEWVEEPNMVKEEVKHFSQKRFHHQHGCRPLLDGMSFETILE